VPEVVLQTCSGFTATGSAVAVQPTGFLPVQHRTQRTVQGHARDLLLAGLTGHFAFHRNSAIPTVILGGDGSFHFAFHPEKDGNVRMAGLSSLQKMEISIL
jgi:hypothetical protein